MTSTGFESAKQAELAFYEALRNGDAAALDSIWANEEQIICIHPNGPRLTGIDLVRASWQAILDGGPIEVRARQQSCTTTEAIAVHNLVEEITIRSERNSETLYCYATNVYAHTPDGWRMILHHAAPTQDEPEQHERTSAVLH